MQLPGFTAEASLFYLSAGYCTSGSVQTVGGEIVPQFRPCGCAPSDSTCICVCMCRRYSRDFEACINGC
jgi:hypothetical protein